LQLSDDVNEHFDTLIKGGFTLTSKWVRSQGDGEHTSLYFTATNTAGLVKYGWLQSDQTNKVNLFLRERQFSELNGRVSDPWKADPAAVKAVAESISGTEWIGGKTGCSAFIEKVLRATGVLSHNDRQSLRQARDHWHPHSDR